MMENTELIVSEGQEGQRLDVFLTAMLPSHSRSFLKILIKDHHVLVNGQTAKPNHKLKKGDGILVTVPEPKEISLTPEAIEIDIIYEDKDIAVVNKPQGMVVHPAVGNYSGTLVNALLYQCTQLSGINGEIRPGIVHRIDKDTTGLLVVAKNNLAHRDLASQIKDKTAARVYYALVEKNIKNDNGTIIAPIGRHPSERKKMAVVKDGREAVTHYKVIERFGDYTLIEANLETGRTHQIRVHMTYIGHPLVGDPLYGLSKQRFTMKGQALHAIKLGLNHPVKGEYMEFYAPLPEHFERILTILRNKSKKN